MRRSKKRGEVAALGDNRHRAKGVPDENTLPPATSAELRINRREISAGRKLAADKETIIG